MGRQSYSSTRDVTNSLAQRFGSRPAEVDGATLITHPPGTSVPTTPGRTVARPVPQGRSPASLIGAAVDVSCAIYSVAPNAFVTDFADAGVPSLSNSTKHGLMQNVCGYAPGPDLLPGLPPPPAAGPPFTGGQCECARYRVRVNIQSQDGSSNVTRTESGLRGPIRGVRPLLLRGADGEINGTRAIVTHGSDDCGGVRETEFGPGVPSVGEAGRVAIVEIINQDGPDDCGDTFDPSYPDTDLLPAPPGGSIPAGDGGPPIIINPGISIGVGPFGPTLNVNIGGANIAIDIGGVDINFQDAPGDSSPSDCEPPSPEDAGGDPSEPVEPPPEGDTPPPAETPEGNRIIRGAYVTVTGGLGGSTEVLSANGGPPAYFPDLGIVRFRVRSADGRVGWTPPQRLQHRQGYYEVPSFFGAIEVSVNLRPGLSAAVNEVYYVSSTPQPQ